MVPTEAGIARKPNRRRARGRLRDTPSATQAFSHPARERYGHSHRVYAITEHDCGLRPAQRIDSVPGTRNTFRPFRAAPCAYHQLSQRGEDPSAFLDLDARRRDVFGGLSFSSRARWTSRLIQRDAVAREAGEVQAHERRLTNRCLERTSSTVELTSHQPRATPAPCP